MSRISRKADREILIHPGFHKTGTTYLQECVFSNETIFNDLCSHQEVHELLVKPHDLEFNPGAFRELIGSRLSPLDSRVTDVVSSEILSGTMFTGSRDSAVLAERLQSVWPQAKIVFTIRAQGPWMRSVYIQYLKRGGRKSFEQFLRHTPEPGYHWFATALLEYDKLVFRYASLFGLNRIIVLPQELLQADRTCFLQHLFQFAGVSAKADPASASYEGKRGKSPPASGAGLLRLANLFRAAPMNPEGPAFLSFLGNSLVRASYRVPSIFGKADEKAQLDDLIGNERLDGVRASNRRLQEFVPVDLSKFGYAI